MLTQILDGPKTTWGELMATSVLDDNLFNASKGAKNCVTSAGEFFAVSMRKGGIKKE